MPTTSTTYGAPLPVDTDAADLPKAMSDYANAIEPKLRRGTPFAMAAGVVTTTLSGGTTKNVQITYPTNRFTAAPVVTCSVLNGNQSIIAKVHVTNSPASGYLVLAAATGTLPTTGTVDINWIAVQMQSGQAVG